MDDILLDKTRDMKLILLKIYYEDKPAPTKQELVNDIHRLFTCWSVTKTEASKYHEELHRTAKGARTNTKTSLPRGRENSETGRKLTATSRYLGGLFGGLSDK